jgi:two-component system sensor histidine kinase BaeS
MMGFSVPWLFPMRRLAHSLTLLLVGFTLLTVLAMGALVAWNLQRGFDDYLQARETSRLTRFAEVLQMQLDSTSLVEAIHWPRELQLALRAFGASEWSASAGRLHPSPDPLAGKHDGPPGAKAPLPGGPEGFGGRMALYSPEGLRLAGRPMAEGATYLEARILREGQLIALARLRKPAAAPDVVDASFIARQHVGIGGVALLLLLLAGAAGHFAAAWWVEPLLALQRSTVSIACGQPHLALDESRSDEIGDLMRNVNHMAASLRRLEASRRRWMAEISHELRTPLTVLRGEIEALADGVRPLSMAAVESLREEVGRLSRLVNDLHMLAMSDLGALACRPTEVEPREAVQAAHRRAADRATAAGHQMSLSLPPPSRRCRAAWDGQRIAQVLDNLLTNSIDHTHSPGCIALALSCSADEAVVIIEDSAPGVSVHELPQIFEPLFRADPARSGEGSGLGLAIAKAIVDAHCGRIEVAVSPLGGLRMTVVLPLAALELQT